MISTLLALDFFHQQQHQQQRRRRRLQQRLFLRSLPFVRPSVRPVLLKPSRVEKTRNHPDRRTGTVLHGVSVTSLPVLPATLGRTLLLQHQRPPLRTETSQRRRLALPLPLPLPLPACAGGSFQHRVAMAVMAASSYCSCLGPRSLARLVAHTQERRKGRRKRDAATNAITELKNQSARPFSLRLRWL